MHMRLFRDFLLFLVVFAVVPSLNGCSVRPSSELTKEQLEKQRAEDASSLEGAI